MLLDPPYSHSAGRDNGLYSVEGDISHEVREWAIEHGDDPLFRIALCGYDTEHGEHMPDNWMMHNWKTGGGYGNLGNGNGRANRWREVVWFSPHCLKPNEHEQLSLFEEVHR